MSGVEQPNPTDLHCRSAAPTAKLLLHCKCSVAASCTLSCHSCCVLHTLQTYLSVHRLLGLSHKREPVGTTTTVTRMTTAGPADCRRPSPNTALLLRHIDWKLCRQRGVP